MDRANELVILFDQRWRANGVPTRYHSRTWHPTCFL